MINDIKTMSQLQKEYQEEIKTYKPINFGYPTATRVFGSFKSTEVLTIAARSGVGKTNFGMTFGRNIAHNDNGVCLFVSLEMGGVSVYERASNIALSYMKNEPLDIDTVTKELKSMRSQNLINCHWDGFLTIDKPGLTLEIIGKYVETLKSLNHVSCVVIDYLGYIKDTQSGSNYERVSRIAKGCKELAKEQKIRLINLVQTSRDGEDGTVPVKLHHLRDSGAIEESADYIMGAWNQKDLKVQDVKEIPTIVCESLKNRKRLKGDVWGYENMGLNFIEVDIERT